eukprot:TRINITY_DN94260_c0_g1_i1.p1 TRINITY_DN94260_c0_g1~~TRINITY_DN94260_c0_g1_i1.p1  ORF type:complete len:408 (-),score=101.05 TRINITY_DN94260_c0_g1_i1:123-1325(-)
MGPQLLSSDSLFEKHADCSPDSQDKLARDTFRRYISKVMTSHNPDVDGCILDSMAGYMETAIAGQFGTGQKEQRLARGISRACLADSFSGRKGLDLKLLTRLFDGSRRRRLLEWWFTPASLRAAIRSQKRADQSESEEVAPPDALQSEVRSQKRCNQKSEEVALPDATSAGNPGMSAPLATRLDVMDALIQDLQQKVVTASLAKRLDAAEAMIQKLQTTMEELVATETEKCKLAEDGDLHTTTRLVGTTALEAAVREQQQASEQLATRVDALLKRVDVLAREQQTSLQAGVAHSDDPSRNDSWKAAVLEFEKSLQASEDSTRMMFSTLDDKIENLHVMQNTLESRLNAQAQQTELLGRHHVMTDTKLRSLEQGQTMELRIKAPAQPAALHIASPRIETRT